MSESYDLDLAMMEDDALIVLAKECQYGPARDELLLRYQSQIDRLIHWLARTTSLSNADIEDARQNAVFWTLEAIEKYNTEQIAKAGGCSFFSFLNRVLICRFKDHNKHLRRRERHFMRAAGAETQNDQYAESNVKPNDPASIAEAQESQTRLYAAIAQMDSESCRIWELMAEGSSLREISTELGISYDAVKRRRRKILNHLKTCLASR